MYSTTYKSVCDKYAIRSFKDSDIDFFKEITKMEYDKSFQVLVVTKPQTLKPCGIVVVIKNTITVYSKDTAVGVTDPTELETLDITRIEYIIDKLNLF